MIDDRITVSQEQLGAMATMRAALDGRLPPRYATDFWDAPFQAAVKDLLSPGQRILDLGAGARPIIPPEMRMAGCEYVGFDVSSEELEKAEVGSYDEIVVGDARQRDASLEGEFDLVVSWLAMEHIKPLSAAIDNVHSYLRPGGTLLAQLPGRFSPFSLLNLLLPSAFTRLLLRRTQDRDPETVFPAHYDRCWYDGLAGLFRDQWSEWKVRPLYTGAGYVVFSPVLTAVYLAYEEWLYRRNRRNLAPYYLITATASPERAADGA